MLILLHTFSLYGTPSLHVHTDTFSLHADTFSLHDKLSHYMLSMLLLLHYMLIFHNIKYIYFIHLHTAGLSFFDGRTRRLYEIFCRDLILIKCYYNLIHPPSLPVSHAKEFNGHL